MNLRTSTWIAAICITGLAISATMLARSQVAGDQLNLLSLGWLLAEEGVWTPYGNPTTGAGVTPGGASSIVVGLPLMVWKHHRAPALLIWLSHLLAFWMLDSWLKRILAPEERLLFALLYWLNPWRIYHSVFLWNPNFLFFFGAAHLSTAYAMRNRPRAWMTFWHLLSIGIVLQLEVVALPLAVATLLWWWKRYIRIHRGGAVAACFVVAVSLVPWALAVAESPELMARQEGFLGFGLLMVYPVYRGAMYWVRYSTLGLSEELFCLDYAYLIGSAWMDRLRPFLLFAKTAVYALTVPLSVWALFKFWKGSGHWWRDSYSGDSDREWLVGVVRWGFIAAILVYCIAPSNIMRWHVLAVFQLAILPPVVVFGQLLANTESVWASRGLRVYVTVTLVVILAVAFGAPMIRCGGDRCGRNAVTMPPLEADHPILDELGIRATCPVEVGVPGGFWFHALPQQPSPNAPDGDERHGI
jgi:hypothetical protein